MSQAKVDRYKEEKRNREQIMKKEKREWRMTLAGLGAVAAAIVIWLGASIYQRVSAPAQDTVVETESYTINTTALDDYMNTLNAD